MAQAVVVRPRAARKLQHMNNSESLFCRLSPYVFWFLVTARDVFKLLNTKYKKVELIVTASFFEIYSGKVNSFADNREYLQRSFEMLVLCVDTFS